MDEGETGVELAGVLELSALNDLAFAEVELWDVANTKLFDFPQAPSVNNDAAAKMKISLFLAIEGPLCLSYI